MKDRGLAIPVAVVIGSITFGTLFNLAGATPADSSGEKPNDDCPMAGCSWSRNPVNIRNKNIPTEWSTEEGKQKNIKWMAKLGKVTYGGPIIAGGKIFIGTNNEDPRDPAVKGDHGILMCFREGDGQFLWQAVHDLPATIDQEARTQGIPSSPAVDGNRVYYVSNGCDVVCADVNGDMQKKSANILWRLDMMKELNVFPHKMSNCSPLVAGDLVFAC